jgi:hypothetical protein
MRGLIKSRVKKLMFVFWLKAPSFEVHGRRMKKLILPKSDEKILVRLIDAYPDGGDPLSTRVLQSDSGTTFAVRHDAGCDGPFRNLLLRAAPGDIMAIFPVPLSYQPPLTHIPAPDSLLPCYRVSRR